MGTISDKLLKNLPGKYKSIYAEIKDYALEIQKKRDLKTLLRSPNQIDPTGLDSLHASYIAAQNITSFFSEAISQLPEVGEFAEIVGHAEEEYIPEGPPISPLTRSYFTSWALFDVQFGQDKETMGICLTKLYQLLNLPEELRGIIDLMQQSRMGIYEYRKREGKYAVLKELLSEREFLCHVTSEYYGRKGQLWFIRLLPPVNNKFDYHVVFTTPYVLMNTSETDWLTFINKMLIRIKGSDKIEALSKFMKYGLSSNYWNEFIFQGYHHHQYNVVFLTDEFLMRSFRN